ncbi:MAG: hypothetical protein KDD82_25955 [Planctomycetes bacterium]|nr:hypothetical protein [Planctomycetota bacterium]
MTDDRLRRRERERDLEPDGETRWLSEQLRSGVLDQERLELLATLGHPGAQALAPQAPPPEDDGEAFAEWVAGLTRWGPGCAVRAGLALLGVIPVRVYGSERFDGPDDRLLAAGEALARWAQAPAKGELAALLAAQEQLQQAGYGYGLATALNCAFSLLRIPAEPELAASHLRDACAQTISRVGSAAALRALQRELWPWASGEADPLEQILGGRGARLLRLNGIVRRLVWSEPDRLWTASNAGEVVAYGLDGALQLELPTRERDIYAFACGPRGEVAVGEDSGACELWLDPERPGRRFAASSAVHALAFSSDGAWLWVGTHAGQLLTVELGRDGPPQGAEVAERSLNALCAVGDEVWAAARGGWLLGLSGSGRELRRLGPFEQDAEALAALPDGRLVVSRGRQLVTYDLERGVELNQLEVHTGSVYGLEVVPGAAGQVVSAGGDGALVWSDLDAEVALRRWQTPSTLLACAVSPDGQHALSGARTGLVRKHPLER